MKSQRDVVVLDLLRSCVGCIGLSILISLASGCGQKGSNTSTASEKSVSKRPGAERTVTNYPIKGVVTRVETEDENVSIQHEAIPDFMDAMTMRFIYPDKKSLESLHPGDRVTGTLRVFKENGVVNDYSLLELTVTEPAPRPPLVLDTSKGTLRLAEEPKRLDPGDLVPDFTMILQDGKPLKLSNLRGDVVVLTFIYTRCPLPDFCPLMDNKFADLAARIAATGDRAKTARLISLSFDPDHDTPEVLARHAKSRGAVPPLWTFAVATYEELAKVGPALGLFFRPGEKEVAHNLCTVVIDPEGKVARLEVGTARDKWTTADFFKTVSALLPALKN